MSDNNQNNISDDALSEQLAYADRVNELLGKRYKEQPKAFVNTYGCQQNVSDSEKYKGLLERMGYELIGSPDEADFVLFNTCAVREHAEDRVYGNIGILKNIKRQRPGMIIAMCGCMAQQQTVADKIKHSYPYVDLLFGTGVRHKLPEFIYRHLTTGGRVFDTSEGSRDIVEGLPTKRSDAFKAWLPIMQGCNNFCTYCIVPYVRGRESSRCPDAVISEAKELIASGVKEITLLGQNVNSYGKGETHGVNFAELLRQINALPGDFLIRFMTSHPKDCTKELLTAMAECQKVEKHLHLPVQSGSDRILKAMNRHYDTAKYLSLIDKARRLMPDIQFTSDIIVGFPGETCDDFEMTLELVKKVGYAQLFTFIYSPRTGTPAASLPDDTKKPEKSKRFTELLKTEEQISKRISEGFIGKTVRVLCDEYNDGLCSGKCSENLTVSFNGSETHLGNFVNVEINSFDGILKSNIKER